MAPEKKIVSSEERKVVGYIDVNGDDSVFRHAACAQRADKVTSSPVFEGDNLLPISDRQDPANLKPCAECGALATELPRG